MAATEGSFQPRPGAVCFRDDAGQWQYANPRDQFFSTVTMLATHRYALRNGSVGEWLPIFDDAGPQDGPPETAAHQGAPAAGQRKRAEPGYTFSSPCGRAWFVPASRVRDDYIATVMQIDHVTREAAARYVDQQGPEAVDTWVREQFAWSDVDAYGTLIKQATPDEITQALDLYRDNAGMSAPERIEFTPPSNSPI